MWHVMQEEWQPQRFKRVTIHFKILENINQRPKRELWKCAPQETKWVCTIEGGIGAAWANCIKKSRQMAQKPVNPESSGDKSQY